MKQKLLLISLLFFVFFANARTKPSLETTTTNKEDGLSRAVTNGNLKAKIKAVSDPASWNPIGTVGFSAGSSTSQSLAIDASGTAYVAYRDKINSFRTTVMKFNGTSWVLVGATASFSTGREEFQSLAIDASGTPYVAYSDTANGSKTTVMKFNGTNWVAVGALGFSTGIANYQSLAIDAAGTPYVAYSDVANGEKTTVMKFNGTNWVVVGTVGFSGNAIDQSLAIDTNGLPYVAYSDADNDDKTTVMKYNTATSSWVLLGAAGFSGVGTFGQKLAIDNNNTAYVTFEDLPNSKTVVKKFDGTNWVDVATPSTLLGEGIYQSIAIDASGVLYVAYADAANNFKATVIKYNGTNWVLIGSAGFSAGNASYLSLAIDTSGTPYLAFQDSANNEKTTVMGFFSSLPSLSTATANSITLNTAVLGGSIIKDNGFAVTERGIVYATTANNSDPLIDGTNVTKVKSGSGIGVFSETVTGLTEETVYAFKSYAINSQGTSYGSTQTFTTLMSAPIISALLPANNATAITVDGNLKVTFNQNILKGTGAIEIYNKADDALVETILVDAANVVINDKEVTINPVSNLEKSKSYYVQIATTAFKNKDDVNFAGITDKTTWSFTAELKVVPSITFADFSKTYGDANFDLTATTNSTGTISYEIIAGGTGTATLSGTNNKTVTLGNAGTVSIKATVAADTNYLEESKIITLTINKATITVTADAKSKIYGDTDPSLRYSVSPSLNSGDVLTGSLARATGENVGAYAITSTLANANYTITFVGTNLTISTAGLTVTADANQQKLLGANDPVLSYTITSGNLVSGDNFTGTLSRDAGEVKGSYAISQGTLSAGANYNLNFVSSNFSIKLIITNPVVVSSKFAVISGTMNTEGLNVKQRGLLISETNSNPKLGDSDVSFVVAPAVDVYDLMLAIKAATTVAVRMIFVIDAFVPAGGVVKYTSTKSNVIYGDVVTFQFSATEPEVTTLAPLDNALLVNPEENLIINFDIPVQKGTGLIEIRRISDKTLVESIDVTSSNVTIAGNVVTINPTNDLPTLTDVYVTASLGSFQDMSANNWSGIASTTAWKFKTDNSTLGLDTVNKENALIDMYPNPCNEVLYVKTTNAIIQEVTVYDVLGKAVNIIKLEKDNRIDTSQLTTGVYFLIVKTDRGVITKKIVKQ